MVSEYVPVNNFQGDGETGRVFVARLGLQSHTDVRDVCGELIFKGFYTVCTSSIVGQVTSIC